MAPQSALGAYAASAAPAGLVNVPDPIALIRSAAPAQLAIPNAAMPQPKGQGFISHAWMHVYMVLCAGFEKSNCLPKKRPAPTGDDTRGPMGLKLSGKSLDEKKVMARCCLSYISGVKNHLSLVCGSI